MITLARLFAVTLTLITATLSFAADAKTQVGDIDRGANIFRKNCAGCHINQGTGGRGPNLTDIVDGQPTVPGFKYSSSIKFASWAWTVDQIDRYLQNPAAVVPRATMASQVRRAQDRANIIAYLKTLRSPDGTSPARGRAMTHIEDIPKR